MDESPIRNGPFDHGPAVRWPLVQIRHVIERVLKGTPCPGSFGERFARIMRDRGRADDLLLREFATMHVAKNASRARQKGGQELRGNDAALPLIKLRHGEPLATATPDPALHGVIRSNPEILREGDPRPG